MWVDTAALPRLLLAQTASLLGADFSANLADFSTNLPKLMDGPSNGQGLCFLKASKQGRIHVLTRDRNPFMRGNCLLDFSTIAIGHFHLKFYPEVDTGLKYQDMFKIYSN